MPGSPAPIKIPNMSWTLHKILAFATHTFGIRQMFQGFFERGLAVEPGDVVRLTKLLGHAPKTFSAFAAEMAAVWKANIK